MKSSLKALQNDNISWAAFAQPQKLTGTPGTINIAQQGYTYDASTYLGLNTNQKKLSTNEAWLNSRIAEILTIGKI